jgi:hypothetical protein
MPLATHGEMSGTNALQSLKANLLTVLQPKSSNVRKQSLNKSSASQQEESGVQTRPLKRPAVPSVSNSAKPKKLQPWDATGCYQLICKVDINLSMHPITPFKYITNSVLNVKSMPRSSLVQYLERDGEIVSPGSSHPQEERVGGTIASSRV